VREALPPGGWDTNAELAALAARIPGGWGGVFLENGRPTHLLTDLSKRDQALAALRSEGRAVSPSVVFKQGRWDFGQLYDWYRYLQDEVYAVGGISFSDINERSNRLEYGAVDERTRLRVELTLSRLDLPCFLVAVAIKGYGTTGQ
jgi:hypothetical protein